MDPETIFSVVVFVIWLLSQIAANVKKGQPSQAPTPMPASRPKRAAPPIVDIGAFDKLEARFQAGLPELEPKVRALALDHYERGVREESRRARESKDIGRLKDVRSRLDEILGTARMLEGKRKSAEDASALLAADRLVEEIDTPLRDFARVALLDFPLPPAVAVVHDPKPSGGTDRLVSSPVAASMIFVPRAVSWDPRHWMVVAHEVARYIGNLAPGIYSEVEDRLRLRVSQADLEANREALLRLLFGSFLARTLGDAVGASLFGPAYLSALASLYAEPEAPSRVTTIYLNQDGTVYPEPPAHLRIHLTSEWLTQMGFAGKAEEIRRTWDERHGYPERFAIHGSMATIPSPSLLDSATSFMQQLYAIEFPSLGMRTLDALPGLASPRVRRASASARELIAKAIASAVDTPENGVVIAKALFDSFRGVTAGEPGPAAVRATVSETRLRPSATEVAEALLLGEIVLTRRGGAPSPFPPSSARSLPPRRRIAR